MSKAFFNRTHPFNLLTYKNICMEEMEVKLYLYFNMKTAVPLCGFVSFGFWFNGNLMC